MQQIVMLIREMPLFTVCSEASSLFFFKKKKKKPKRNKNNPHFKLGVLQLNCMST